MSYRTLGILLIVIVVLGEGVVALWRHLPVEPSSAPVFTFPPAAQNFGKPGEFAPSIKLYGADRGAEWKHTAADGTRLTVFYFEWDSIHVGPLMDFVGHSPEVCNVAAGFTFRGVHPRCSFEIPDQPPLSFDTTHFDDPSGRSVYVFKMPWIQGLGSRKFREGAERTQRLQNSFLRHTGAARVLQAGVFGARDADHAWQIFREQVLDQLEWR
jgi:hypothetical protein